MQSTLCQEVRDGWNVPDRSSHDGCDGQEGAGRQLLIQADQRALISRLSPVLGGGAWAGMANGTFTNVMQRWEAALVKLNTALNGIANTIDANSKNYDSTEQANTTQFHQVGSAL